MRLLLYGGMALTLLGIGSGAWLAAKKKKFVLVYASAALLLVMTLLWWVLPITRFLQNTPDEAVEYVHLSVLSLSGSGGDGSSVTEPLPLEAQADVLAALRATSFSHEGKHNHSYVSGELYYHGNIYIKGKPLQLDVFVRPDGTADAFVGTGAPWRYRAADPALLAGAVRRALKEQTDRSFVP